MRHDEVLGRVVAGLPRRDIGGRAGLHLAQLPAQLDHDLQSAAAVICRGGIIKARCIRAAVYTGSWTVAQPCRPRRHSDQMARVRERSFGTFAETF
jgi:hypothetical protein